MTSLRKILSIKRLIYGCVYTVLVTAIIGFVGSRFDAFLNGYGETKNLNEKMLKKRIDCLSLGDHWDECMVYINYIPEYPVMGGIDAVWKITYLCIDQPCTDILVSVLSSFGGILILLIILLFVFTFSWFQISKWYHTRQRELMDMRTNYDLGFDTHAALPSTSFYSLYSSPSVTRHRTPQLITNEAPA